MSKETWVPEPSKGFLHDDAVSTSLHAGLYDKCLNSSPSHTHTATWPYVHPHPFAGVQWEPPKHLGRSSASTIGGGAPQPVLEEEALASTVERLEQLGKRDKYAC